MTYLRYLAFLSLAAAQTILVDGTSDDGSFEGAGTTCPTGNTTYQGWTIVNGTQTNRWAVNTAAGAQHGSQAIYITNDCGGSPPPHAYNMDQPSVVHFYRDVTLPAGQPYLSISAYIKVQGERLALRLSGYFRSADERDPCRRYPSALHLPHRPLQYGLRQLDAGERQLLRYGRPDLSDHLFLAE